MTTFWDLLVVVSIVLLTLAVGCVLIAVYDWIVEKTRNRLRIRAMRRRIRK